jgi:TetR/AcrR family tetracycline transcriptional repressor
MTLRSEASVPARTHSLNRAAVVTAALNLIDQDGPQAVTMRAIAGRLGVRAQSLYTHVVSRQDLFDAVADRIVGEIDDDLAMRHVLSDPWQHYLAGTAHAVRQYARHHPNAFVLLATHPTHPARPLLSQRWKESVLTNIQHSGFTDDDAAFACRAFDAFLLGSLLLETRELTSEPGRTQTCPRTLPTHLDPHRTLTTHTPLHRPDGQHDDDFTSALDNVIDRITARVGRHTHAAT